MGFIEGSKFQERLEDSRKKQKAHGPVSSSLWLCEIHSPTQTFGKSVAVWAETGDKALEKCKLKYGNDWYGTYRSLHDIIN